MTPYRRLATLTDLSAPMGSHWLLSSATRNSDERDWSPFGTPKVNQRWRGDKRHRHEAGLLKSGRHKTCHHSLYDLYKLWDYIYLAFVTDAPLKLVHRLAIRRRRPATLSFISFSLVGVMKVLGLGFMVGLLG